MVDPFDAAGRRSVTSKTRCSTKRQLSETIRLVAGDFLAPAEPCRFIDIKNFLFSFAVTLQEREFVESFRAVPNLLARDLQHLPQQLVIEPTQQRRRIERVSNPLAFCFRETGK